MIFAPVFATSRSIFIPEKKVTFGEAKMMWRTGHMEHSGAHVERRKVGAGPVGRLVDANSVVVG